MSKTSKRRLNAHRYDPDPESVKVCRSCEHFIICWCRYSPDKPHCVESMERFRWKMDNKHLCADCEFRIVCDDNWGKAKTTDCQIMAGPYPGCVTAEGREHAARRASPNVVWHD